MNALNYFLQATAVFAIQLILSQVSAAPDHNRSAG
jgi:hypothetical protein